MKNEPLVKAAKKLSREASKLSFSKPVAYIYNPLKYAWENHKSYLEKFGDSPKEIALVGMNPGPWGMAQTGVPFGVVWAARDWMNIHGEVKKPGEEHPRRPVTGYDCPRTEVSGKRLWSWAKDRFGRPENFFDRFFVMNYCPLSFLEEGGKNRTPNKLPKKERKNLFEVCDRHLKTVVDYFQPDYLIGIGKFAESRIEDVFPEEDRNFKTGAIIHPSPANPQAAHNWDKKIEGQLRDLGIEL